MNDKHRLSSEQVLDDYFFDLLAEPEELEPAVESQPQSDVDAAAEADIEHGDDDVSLEQEPQGTDSAPDLNIGTDEAVSDDKPSHDKADAEQKPNDDTDAEASMSDGAATDGVIENDVVEAATEDEFAIGSKVPVGEGASPFDFEQLSTAAEQPSETEVSVELNLSPPTSKLSSWLPQAQDVPRESMSLEAMSAEPVPLDAMPVKITPHETVRNESLPPVSFAEHPQTELEGVQRLLSQMSQMQSDIQQESEALIAAQTEADFLAASYQESQQESHPAPHDSLLVAEETLAEPKPAELEPVVQAEEEAEPEVANEPVEPELGQPDSDVQVALETQTGGDEPPDVWQQQPESGAEFQALFFEVNGVTFAVPLTELGGIHQLGEVNHLLGRPAWYLGLMTNREHQLDVVDTARWVMPEKLSSDEHQEEYRYIVMLGESKWGLACNVLHGTETLTELSVRWREKAGKRPWLAGMVKEKMCALIHVSELISMLNAGLDVKSVM